VMVILHAVKQVINCFCRFSCCYSFYDYNVIGVEQCGELHLALPVKTCLL